MLRRGGEIEIVEGGGGWLGGGDFVRALREVRLLDTFLTSLFMVEHGVYGDSRGEL